MRTALRLRSSARRRERAPVEKWSSRIDPAFGIREEAAFLDVGGDGLFSCRHIPLGPVRGTVVVCPSILFDLTQNYRREVSLAREFASHGFAVQRFHYRGMGHSGGELSSVTLASMVEDAERVTQHIVAREGPVAFVGTRWGAIVAAACARHHPGAPLVLWEPAVSSESYFREAFRARSVRLLKQAGFDQSALASPFDGLADDGYVDVLGFAVHRALVESAAGCSLADEVAGAPRAILLIQLASRASLRRDYQTLVDGWRRAGFPTDAACISCQDSWWFYQKIMSPTDQLVRHTRLWFERAVTGTVPETAVQ